MTISRRLAAFGGGALALTGCSPVQLLGAVAGRDGATVKLATGIPYGAHPRQALDLHAPEARAGTPLRPVAIFFYGGSWDSGSRGDYDFAGAALASRGFLTAVPDYRLYPDVRFPDFLQDGAAAVRWVRDNASRFGGDGRRLVLVGHSAGAYNAAMLALDRQYLARAGVPAGAVRAWAGLSGPYDFLPLDAGTAQNVFGAWPDPRATQPVAFVDGGDPPAYLATGDADTTVRPRNTTALAARYRRAGVRVVERVFPGLEHRDTLLALTVLFRAKAPILDEMSAFLRERS